MDRAQQQMHYKMRRTKQKIIRDLLPYSYYNEPPQDQLNPLRESDYSSQMKMRREESQSSAITHQPFDLIQDKGSPVRIKQKLSSKYELTKQEYSSAISAIREMNKSVSKQGLPPNFGSQSLRLPRSGRKQDGQNNSRSLQPLSKQVNKAKLRALGQSNPLFRQYVDGSITGHIGKVQKPPHALKVNLVNSIEKTNYSSEEDEERKDFVGSYKDALEQKNKKKGAKLSPEQMRQRNIQDLLAFKYKERYDPNKAAEEGPSSKKKKRNIQPKKNLINKFEISLFKDHAAISQITDSKRTPQTYQFKSDRQDFENASFMHGTYQQGFDDQSKVKHPDTMAAGADSETPAPSVTTATGPVGIALKLSQKKSAVGHLGQITDDDGSLEDSGRVAISKTNLISMPPSEMETGDLEGTVFDQRVKIMKSNALSSTTSKKVFKLPKIDADQLPPVPLPKEKDDLFDPSWPTAVQGRELPLASSSHGSSHANLLDMKSQQKQFIERSRRMHSSNRNIDIRLNYNISPDHLKKSIQDVYGVSEQKVKSHRHGTSSLRLTSRIAQSTQGRLSGHPGLPTRNAATQNSYISSGSSKVTSREVPPLKGILLKNILSSTSDLKHQETSLQTTGRYGRGRLKNLNSSVNMKSVRLSQQLSDISQTMKQHKISESDLNHTKFNADDLFVDGDTSYQPMPSAYREFDIQNIHIHRNKNKNQWSQVELSREVEKNELINLATVGGRLQNWLEDTETEDLKKLTGTEQDQLAVIRSIQKKLKVYRDDRLHKSHRRRDSESSDSDNLDSEGALKKYHEKQVAQMEREEIHRQFISRQVGLSASLPESAKELTTDRTLRERQEEVRNHIIDNIKIAPKIKQIQYINTIYKNIMQQENSEFAQAFVEGQNKAKIDLARLQMNRWDEFKKRRLTVMKAYVDALKLKYSSELFIKHSALLKILRVLAMNFKLWKMEKLRSMNSAFISIHLSIIFKRKLLRNYGHYGHEGLMNKIKNQIRYGLMTYGQLMILTRNAELEEYRAHLLDNPGDSVDQFRQAQVTQLSQGGAQKSMYVRMKYVLGQTMKKTEDYLIPEKQALDPYKVVHGFLASEAQKVSQCQFQNKLVRKYELILRVQKSIQSRRISLSAKAEVFITKWDRLCYRLVQKAQVKKDTQMKEFAKLVMTIPAHIKLLVATEFIEQCMILHSIAFFEWRLHFARNEDTFSTYSEVEHLIEMHKETFEQSKEAYALQLKKYEKSGLAELQSKFPLDQKRIDSFIREEPRSSTIVNSFDQIGLPVLEFKAEKTSKPDGKKGSTSIITSSDMKPQKSTSKKKKSKVENSADIAEQIAEQSEPVDEHTAYLQQLGLTYPVKKYIPAWSPQCTYIPSNRMLIKLMRASIYVQSVEDSLYFRKKEFFGEKYVASGEK